MKAHLKNWIPYHIGFEGGQWHVDWLDLGDHHIQEPFFDETISICRARMRMRSRFHPQSDLAFLLQAAAGVKSLTPTAFIFHVSRCGSTLLSQALAAAQDHIVIAEAPLLDQVLRMREKDVSLTEQELKGVFLAAIQLMGKQRTGREKHYFIKLDSWHLHFYALLREWFPDTPFYFLSREPAAVLASHYKRRGIHGIPGYILPAVFAIELKPAHFEDFNLYTATVLGGYYDRLKRYHALNFPHNHFYDYRWGMQGMVPHFQRAIGLEFLKPAMIDRIAFHSKYPDRPFQTEMRPDASFRYEIAETAYSEYYKTLHIHG